MTSDHHLRMAEPSTNSVSMSVTTALIYGVSGTFFFLLVFLLVMMGLTNCDWHCRRENRSFVVSLIDFPLFRCFKMCRRKHKNRGLPSRLDWTFVDIEKR